MAYVPNSGSVIAFQSNPGSLQASVTGTITVRNGASISGTVGASVIGTVPVTQTTTPWVITGSVQGSFSPAANQSVSGTVGASVIGVVPMNVQGSVGTVIIGGSIAASFTPPANQSVSGTVGASVIGTVPTTQSGTRITSVSGVVQASVQGAVSIAGGNVAISNFPTTQNVSGSVVAFQGTTPWTTNTAGSVAVNIIAGSVAVSVTPPANQSVSGTVNVGTGGPVSVVGTMSVLGAVPVTQSTTPWLITGSVQAAITPSANQSVSGTVGASVIGTVPVTQSGTRITSVSGVVNVAGSVAATIVDIDNSSVITVWQNPSIVGTYSEDDAHSTGQRGLMHLGVRNDAVASFAGASLDYTPIGLDSAGRTLTKPFAPGEASVVTVTSLVSAGTTASVQLMAAGGAGIKNYITDFMLANTGGTTTLAIFADADASIIGRTIVPAGGGSNQSLQTPIVNIRPNTPINLQIGSSSSVVYATVTGYRAP